MPFLKRKHVRLKKYDYGTMGAYLITICTHNRENLFWKDLKQLNIHSNSEIKLNHYGKIAKQVWLNSEKTYDDIILDAYAVMPNHFHGIIIKERNSKRKIGFIVGQFKSMVTKEIQKYEPNIKIWQRNYHEHIIREQESDIIQYYVLNNPYNFSNDKYL